MKTIFKRKIVFYNVLTEKTSLSLWCSGDGGGGGVGGGPPPQPFHDHRPDQVQVPLGVN